MTSCGASERERRVRRLVAHLQTLPGFNSDSRAGIVEIK